MKEDGGGSEIQTIRSWLWLEGHKMLGLRAGTDSDKYVCNSFVDRRAPMRCIPMIDLDCSQVVLKVNNSILN